MHGVDAALTPNALLPYNLVGVCSICPAALDAAQCLARIGTPSEELAQLTCTNDNSKAPNLPACTENWLKGPCAPPCLRTPRTLLAAACVTGTPHASMFLLACLFPVGLCKGMAFHFNPLGCVFPFKENWLWRQR